MVEYAQSLGNFLSGFTGEHVGEPRLLICLYDEPLLHVDLKFVTPEEFSIRVENPIILFDKNNVLKTIIENTEAHFPSPDFQWIEDRFWKWGHYILQMIERGELFEAIDALSFVRSTVLGPLLHIKEEQLARGVRKLEFMVS